MNKLLNNTVCKACGKISDSLERMGLNGDDPICAECRSYEQMMIQNRIANVQRKQDENRCLYFSYLESDLL